MRESPDTTTGSANRSSVKKAALVVILLALHLSGLLYVNLGVLRYPFDNDLQYIAWISEHLDLHRPQSLGNNSYPLGFPLLMRMFDLVTGSFLISVLACQAIASTALVAVVFAVVRGMTKSPYLRLLATGMTAILILPVSTSEFADTICVTLVLVGFLLTSRADFSAKSFLRFGACVGGAFLFRFHYLALLGIVPMIVALIRELRTGWTRRAGWYFVGFCLGALPLISVNLILGDNPFHTGISAYKPGYDVMRSVDWKNFPATYGQWPISRLVLEQPLTMATHILRSAMEIIRTVPVLASLILAPLAWRFLPAPPQRIRAVFLAALIVSFIGATMLPTKVTDRGMLLAMVGCSIVISFGIGWFGQKLEKLSRRAGPILAGLLWIVFANSAFQSSFLRWGKTVASRVYNEELVAVLVANGMTRSDEVFSNDWGVFNLADPKFLPFHNFGGYMLLDDEYAAMRPLPKALTADQWDAFFREEHIRFAVLAKGQPEIRKLYASPLPQTWTRIKSDRLTDVFKLEPF